MFTNTNAHSDILGIRDYAHAVRQFNEIEPIRGRGRNAGIKPLGDRRKPHVQIIESAYDSGTSDPIISVKLYDTEILQYHPDGRINIFFDGFDTQTTLLIMNIVLRRASFSYIHQTHNRVWLSSTKHGKDYALRTDADNWMRTDAEGYLEPADGDVLGVVVHRVNRAGAKAVRAKLQPFKNYVLRMHKLRGGVYSGQEYVETMTPMFLNAVNEWGSYKIQSETASDFRHPEHLDPSNDSNLDKCYETMLKVVLLSSGLQHFARVNMINHLRDFTVSEERLMAGFENQLKRAYRDDMLVEEKVYGRVVRDNYAKYFAF